MKRIEIDPGTARVKTGYRDIGKDMRERKKPAHRPSFGIHETRFILSAPLDLVERMKSKAEKDGISTAEAWRRAARKWLGLKPDAYEKYLEAKETDE